MAEFVLIQTKTFPTMILSCQIGSYGRVVVTVRYHFETATKLRDASVSRSMIDDLERSIRFLRCDISTEEERVGVFNITDPLYPALARTLSVRLDNLKATVEALQRRLAETAGHGVALQRIPDP